MPFLPPGGTLDIGLGTPFGTLSRGTNIGLIEHTRDILSQEDMESIRKGSKLGIWPNHGSGETTKSDVKSRDGSGPYVQRSHFLQGSKYGYIPISPHLGHIPYTSAGVNRSPKGPRDYISGIWCSGASGPSEHLVLSLVQSID